MGPVHGDAEDLKNPLRRIFHRKKLKQPALSKIGTHITMSCYICLEEDGQLLQAKGCGCKGSVAIHQACLQEWLKTAENPFQCTVCKMDYPGTFLNTFLSTEDIMFHSAGQEEPEQEEYQGEVNFIDFHGIPIMETEHDLIFLSEEHRSIYLQSVSKEHRSIKLETIRRQKNSIKFHAKHQPRAVRAARCTRFARSKK
jgi:hypothetical protein